MDELKVLHARITQLEVRLSNQRRVILTEVRKMIDFHTHTLGGRVVWEFPPEVVKKGLEKMADAKKKPQRRSNAEEKVPVSDKFEFTIKEVGEKVV